jgi:hypothetical protein
MRQSEQPEDEDRLAAAPLEEVQRCGEGQETHERARRAGAGLLEASRGVGRKSAWVVPVLAT